MQAQVCPGKSETRCHRLSGPLTVIRGSTYCGLPCRPTIVSTISSREYPCAPTVPSTPFNSIDAAPKATCGVVAVLSTSVFGVQDQGDVMSSRTVLSQDLLEQQRPRLL